MAIVSRWLAGGMAFMAYHAVSGASVTITSATTATGTVGSNFAYLITLSDESFVYLYSASFTPDGIQGLTNSTTPFISGIPITPQVKKMTVVVSDANGIHGSVSSVITITINPNAPPTIQRQPTNFSLLAGGSFTLSVTASNAASYQWFLNSNAIPSATASSYTVNNAQATNGGNYYVTITNSLGSINSATAQVTVGAPPLILTQPQNLVLNQGGGGAFNVGISGSSSNVTYQWFYNLTNALAGATNSSYSVSNVQWNTAGSYSVSVSNSYGNTLSSNASLVVAGVLQFRNNVGVTLRAPVYATEPTNATASKTGNTSAGFPAGTQVYGGSPLSGTNYTAQLWAALGSNQPSTALVAVPGALVNFSSLGFFSAAGAQPVIPGAVEGAIATLQLRAWNNKGGTVTNWTQVLANTNAERGLSSVFNSPPLGGVISAPAMQGLTSFNLYFPSPTPVTTPLVLAGSRQGGLFSISFPSIISQTYVVEYVTNLPSSTWLALTNVTATSTNTVVRDNIVAASRRFYRARLATNSLLPLVMSGRLQAGQILLGFNANIGKGYTVQYGSLNGVWNVLTNLTAQSTNPVARDTVSATNRFYRVVTTSP